MQCYSCLFICNGLDFRVTLFSSPIHVLACIHGVHKFGLLQIYECFCSLEKVYLRRLRGQAKVFGTMVTVVGALLMTLVKGPMFNLPWANGNAHQESTNAANKQDITKGALMILASSLSGSGFFILQVRV